MVELVTAELTVSGGSLAPAFFAISPAIILVNEGGISSQPIYETGLEKQYIRLDRLTRLKEIVDGNSVNIYFQKYLQNMCEGIEQAFNSIRDQVDAQQAILDELQQARGLAQQATEIAMKAQSELSIATSAPVPLQVLSAATDGSITIIDHNRDYSGTRVSVDGGVITGLTGGLFYRVYYNDAGREGGAVKYIATQEDVTQAGAIHVVGGVYIPTSDDSVALTITPPGYISALV